MLIRDGRPCVWPNLIVEELGERHLGRARQNHTNTDREIEVRARPAGCERERET